MISRLFFSWIYLDLEGKRKALAVESHRLFKNLIIVKLKGIESMDQAQGLVGLHALVPEEDLPPLEDEQFYAYRLKGFEVKAITGEKIGCVIDAVSQAGNDLLVIERKGREVLVPFVRDVCIDVRMEKRTVIVDLPEGLLDLNEI